MSMGIKKAVADIKKDKSTGYRLVSDGKSDRTYRNREDIREKLEDDIVNEIREIDDSAPGSTRAQVDYGLTKLSSVASEAAQLARRSGHATAGRRRSRKTRKTRKHKKTHRRR